MQAIWDESSSQASAMLHKFIESSLGKESVTRDSLEGFRTITINVIGSVVFGTHQERQEEINLKAPAGFKTTMMESMLTIVENLLVSVFVSTKFLTLPFMPKAARRIGLAKTEFPRHLQQMINQERQHPSAGKSLLASLVKIADQDKGGEERSMKGSTYLTPQEITGNLFNFTIAGFDTTANTMSYAIAALSISPEWQDWIIAGIDEARSLDSATDYAFSFPLMTRCLALMVSIPFVLSPLLSFFSWFFFIHAVFIEAKAYDIIDIVRNAPSLHSSFSYCTDRRRVTKH